MIKSEIIKLICAALECPIENSAFEIDFDALYEVAKRHQIENLLFYGMAKYGVKGDGANWERFYNRVCKNIYISEMQQYEAQKIFDAFEKGKIEYIPLKGLVLKQLYHKPDMRIMSDLDILIKERQYTQISEIMKSLGYKELQESDHELVWSNGNFICIELHKRLIPSYNKDYYAYYGDGWRFAQANKDSQLYKMSPEDEYVYLFTHMAKHYRDSGVGIKQVIDMWVYMQKNPQMDKIYIKNCLRELNLDVFHSNICDLLAVWIDGKEHTEITKKIMDFVFDSGVYGTPQNMIMSYEVKNKSLEKKNGRIKLLVKKVFKPISFMKKRYPVLKRVPVLLPFMWFVRLIDAIINKKKRVADLFEKLSPKEIAHYKNELASVGLSYNFDV